MCSVFIFVRYVLEARECNTTSDWLNHTVWPIRRTVTFKFANFEKKKEK